MAVPGSKEARMFYRCAFQRLEDAQVLLQKTVRPARYMAGYGVECILKAVILAGVPSGDVEKTLESFRGNLAHNYDWLKEEIHRTRGRAFFPRDINRRFTEVNFWSTDLRYEAGTVRSEVTQSFFGAAIAIIHWADGRL